MIDRDREGDVFLGYPRTGMVAGVFMDSVLAAYDEDTRRAATGIGKRRLVGYHPETGPYIHQNRSDVARYFLDCTDFQWLWMLDSDMDFPVDSLYRLLDAAEEHDCKILGAAYWNGYGFSNVYLSWLLFTPEHGMVALPQLPDPDQFPVAELSALGMGCTLIHRDVLQDVADSYANDPWDTFGADILVRFSDGGLMSGRTPEELKVNGRQVDWYQRVGEDVCFCLRARRCGHVAYGLPSLVADHFKQMYVPHGMPSVVPVASS